MTNTISQAVQIARLEIRRYWRTGPAGRRFAILGAGTTVPVGLVAAGIAKTTGHYPVPNLTAAESRAVVGAAVLVTAVGVVLSVASRTVRAGGSIDAPSLLLTTVPESSVLLGLLLTEFVRTGILLGLPLSTGITLAATATEVTLAPLAITIPVLLVPTFGLAVIVGYAIGLLCCLGLGRPSDSVLAWLGIGGIALILILPTDWIAAMFPPTGNVTALSGPYVNGLFAGTRLRPSVPPSSGFLVLGMIVAGPIGYGATRLLAHQHWFGSIPARSRKAKSTSPPSVLKRSAATRSAWYQLIRSRRATIRLVPVAITFVQATIPFVPILGYFGPGPFVHLAPFVVGFTGVLVTGAAFSYNPIGGDGEMVQLTLTSAPRTILRSRLVAGYLVGLPIAGLGSIVVGLLAWGPTPILLAVGVFSAFIAGCVGAIALFLGTRFPRFQTETVVGGGELVWPTRRVLILFPSLCLWSFVVCGVCLFFPAIPAFFLPVSNTIVTVVGLGLLSLLAVSATIAYHQASDQIVAYRLS